MKHGDASTKPEPIKDRIRTLLEKRGITQAQLAEEAELPPTTVSRLMNGERDPRMEHVLAIATALRVTVAELVGGTTAEAVLSEWIPKERYDESERDRLTAVNDLEVARAEIKGRDAEGAALRGTIATLTKQNGTLEGETARQRAELDVARKQREELQQSRAEAAAIGADNQRLRAEGEEYKKRLAECHAKLTNAARAYEDARARVIDVQRQLIEAKGNAVGSAALAALLGGVFGAALVSSGGSSSGSSSRTTVKRRT